MRTRRAGNGARGIVRGADVCGGRDAALTRGTRRQQPKERPESGAAEFRNSEPSGRAGLFLSAPAGAVAMILEIATRDRRQPGTEVPSSVTGTYVSCAKNEKLVEF